jgi:hypothetical protein
LKVSKSPLYVSIASPKGTVAGFAIISTEAASPLKEMDGLMDGVKRKGEVKRVYLRKVSTREKAL